MSLQVGSRVGHFEVTGLLGVGGMGQVYRATDTKLRREVALKILPDELATDPERLSRFEREAQALAALNHSGVAAIYGIEEFDRTFALVLELVPGITLEDRIARGPIAVPEALRLAIGIAAAVEVAHERGIVHRDLKPANIKIQDDGTVKVLDFGLAKALSGDGRHGPAIASSAPTQDATAPGLILGTAAYMSPEQARAMPVDERTDVWAFGCILFEMLTGRRPFGGARLTDVLANVLKEEPDYSALPADTPPLTRRLVRRCLEKDRRERLRHIADARADLRDSLGLRDSIPAGESGATSAVEAGTRQRTAAKRRALIAGALVATAAMAGIAGWLAAPRVMPVTPKSEMVSFEIGDVSPFAASSPARLAVSPGGTQVVYAGREGKILRSLKHSDQVQARWEDMDCPFFSPDGEWIAYFSGGPPSPTQLTRVSVRGGAPIVISGAAVDARKLGGSWGPDGRIVFATTLGLHRVAASGGEPELFASPDPGQKELYFAAPQILPGGHTVLFTVLPRDPKAAPRVAALDLESLERKTVLTDGAGARYAPTGHLVYIAGGRLQAIAFDVDTLETRGDPQPLLDAEVVGVQFELSDNGTLVYQPSVPAGGAEVLVWVDRDGHQEPIAAPAGAWVYPRISPDGKRVASDRWLEKERDIYIWDLERQNLSRLTDDPGEDVFPHWSADGSRIFFSSNRSGAAFNLYSRPADGSGRDELLLESRLSQMVNGLTPDGAQLLVLQAGPNQLDLVAVDVEEPHQARTLLATKAAERVPSPSPDARWVAYSSDEEGQFEVFVGPFPEIGQRRWKISSGGGDFPLWSAKGDEIFFRGPTGNMMAAQVAVAPTFAPGKVTELFANPSETEFRLGFGGRRYDVSPVDGRFLMVKQPDRSRDDRLVVVMNWFEELKAKVPVT